MKHSNPVAVQNRIMRVPIGSQLHHEGVLYHFRAAIHPIISGLRRLRNAALDGFRDLFEFSDKVRSENFPLLFFLLFSIFRGFPRNLLLGFGLASNLVRKANYKTTPFDGPSISSSCDESSGYRRNGRLSGLRA